MTPEHAEAATAILERLGARMSGLSVCPSEAARTIDPAAWREAMPRVHEAAQLLAESGVVVLTQGSAPVAPGRVVGPYRIALARRAGQDRSPAGAADPMPTEAPLSSPRE